MKYFRLLQRVWRGVRRSYGIWRIDEFYRRAPENVYNCASCGVDLVALRQAGSGEQEKEQKFFQCQMVRVLTGDKCRPWPRLGPGESPSSGTFNGLSASM